MIREFAERREIEALQAQVIRVVVSQDPGAETRFRFRFGRNSEPNIGVDSHGRLKLLTKRLVKALDFVRLQNGPFVLVLYNCPESGEGSPLNKGDFERLSRALKSKFD